MNWNPITYLSKKTYENISPKTDHVYQNNKMDVFHIILLSIVSVTILCMLVTFDYCDLDSLTAWSIDVLDSLFQGKLSNFYQYTKLNLHGALHISCPLSYLELLPLSIWNIPIWIIHSITGVMDATDFWSLCWSKLYLVTLSIATAWIISKIFRLFFDNPNRIFSIYILILAAPELLMSTCYAGQNEILYIFCFSMSLYFYLINDMKKFYIWSIGAITFCSIMLVPFLLLLLLKEKKVIKIGVLTAGTLIPSYLFDFLYRNDVLYQSTKTDLTHMLVTMFDVTAINTVFGEVSVWGILFILLLFYSYKINPNNDLMFREKVIYLIAVLFVLFGLLMRNSFYRLFMYVPFVVLLIVISRKNYQMNIFLFMISTLGRALLSCCVDSPYNMNTGFIMKNSWLSRISDLAGKANLENIGLYDKLMSRFSIFPVIWIMAKVCSVAALILLIIINFPKREETEYTISVNEKISLLGYVLSMPLILALYFAIIL